MQDTHSSISFGDCVGQCAPLGAVLSQIAYLFRQSGYLTIYVHTCTYTYLLIYVCNYVRTYVCVCVCNSWYFVVVVVAILTESCGMGCVLLLKDMAGVAGVHPAMWGRHSPVAQVNWFTVYRISFTHEECTTEALHGPLITGCEH